MNILMMTNTFTPHIGGVARSVEAFTNAIRERGHRVMVIAPEFENRPPNEMDVIRLPAIQHFNGSDFSVTLPLPGFVTSAIEKFQPDIIHSHHPFLVGSTALRVARLHELPLVFTHHTMYEHYTHYVPADSKALKRFVIVLSSAYANLCEHVFAPSESIAEILTQRGVKSPIDVVPTGVNLKKFSGGDGEAFRAKMGIPSNKFLIGHLGRLAPEKNLGFLATAAAEYIRAEGDSHFLLLGDGPSKQMVRNIFIERGIGNFLHMVGSIDYPELVSAYKAMDLFLFASKSETQGMVLTEAMAAGLPVVALDAPGAREVVKDGCNGRLIKSENMEEFISGIKWITSLSKAKKRRISEEALKTAKDFSLDRSVEKSLNVYDSLFKRELISTASHFRKYNLWETAVELVRIEWSVIKGMMDAVESPFNLPVEKKHQEKNVIH